MNERETMVAEAIARHRDLIDYIKSELRGGTVPPAPDAVRTLRELEQQKRWADFLSEYVDFNHGSGISDTAWMEFMDKEHETLPVVRCLCSRCRAALAATEDAR